MNKSWLLTLAGEIEAKYGKETRDKIFGDIENLITNRKSLSAWFDNFITGMDELGDKEFLQRMMAEHCPCGGGYEEEGNIYKELYDKSKNLEEFVDALKKFFLARHGVGGDLLELRGNVLYMTKPPGDNKITGSCGKYCHCPLAKNTDKVVSDIFCHCCTIGHTGRPFQHAFGSDIKMEFIESVICGGKGCTMTVHLPGKNMS